jgi:hypothetical protein
MLGKSKKSFNSFRREKSKRFKPSTRASKKAPSSSPSTRPSSSPSSRPSTRPSSRPSTRESKKEKKITSIPKRATEFFDGSINKDEFSKILSPKEIKYYDCNIYLIRIKIAPEEFIHEIYCPNKVEDTHSEENKFPFYENGWLVDETTKNELVSTLEYDIKDSLGSESYVPNVKKICKGIGFNWVKNQYERNESNEANEANEWDDIDETNDISILLFHTDNSGRELRKSERPHMRYKLCGILLLNNLKNNSIYLNLICSIKKVGSHLLTIAEQIGKYFGKNKIFLRSLVEPMPVYIHKKYRFISGYNNLDLKDSSIKFFSDPKKELENKRKYYVDQWGDMYNLLLINSIYRSVPQATQPRTRSRGKKKEGNILMNIKGNIDDGFGMYKYL